jgi:hypothetical protein
MSTPKREPTMTVVDGREALAYVLVLPKPDGSGVLIDAGAHGITKPQAGFILRRVAQSWEEGRPTVVVLCGSTRFSFAFQEANLRETLAGRIVLSIGCDMRSDAELFDDLTPEAIAKIKADLDELHKRKIDIADEVLVLNVGGYVGDSTQSEIEYAQRNDKPIRWLEPTETTTDTNEAEPA